MGLFRFLLYGFLALSLHLVQAQETQAGPVIEEFGPVYSIPEADLTLSPDKNYKILFDIYSDPGGKGKINPLLSTVARFLNMHGQTGLAADQMQVVVILHGVGVRNVLNPEVYQKEHGRANPNSDLLDALHDAGVELYVCGQSLRSKGFGPEDLAEPVKLSLSAMTALVHFQEEGYQLINFN